jgi:drug/metabolite transporter (DMT)-like permease
MKQTQAMLYALAAYFVFVLYDTLAKLAMAQDGLSPLTVMAVSGTIGSIGLVVTAFAKGQSLRLRPRNLGPVVFIGLCSVAMRYSGITGLKHVPLATFYTLLFSTPLIVMALSAALKHEKLTFVKVTCVVGGFLGVLVSIGPQLSSGGDAAGYLALGLCVLFSAIVTVGTRQVSQKETIESVQLINFLSLGTFGYWGGLAGSVPTPGLLALGMLVAAGTFFVFANILLNVALKHTPASNVAQLHYTQIISGGLMGFLIWHDVPTWNLVAGSALIIASGMVVAAQARKSVTIL